MNILIPMAGRGTRTSHFDIPKPLIKFGNETMIESAVKSLNLDGNYIFITRKYDNEEFNVELDHVLRKLIPDCKIIQINFITEGPASSALLGIPLINNNDKLLIANCDQILKWDSYKFENFITNTMLDGAVVTYNSNTEKNSYVRIDESSNLALEIAEKKVISNHSLNGIHFWKHGKLFVHSALKMISKNDSVNNEYYIAPSYNYLINDGYNIGIYEIDSSEHFAVGTSEDITSYMKSDERADK